MSIWLADVNGKIVKAIVERNFKKFVYRVSNMIIMVYNFNFYFTSLHLDYEFNAFLDSIICSKFRYGVLFQATFCCFQGEDYQILP